ncbi:MAG: quinone-dependent dihydroorotate dehydrogenase [Synechococcaceae cyanobacterium RL_1_2]|nr:quinone-dependent dihydroorotate dehydrogenase [Synechococcaceae cyanobacterium RL_1_2]
MSAIKTSIPFSFCSIKDNPEKSHKQLIDSLRAVFQAQNRWWGKTLTRQLTDNFCFSHGSLTQELWGLTFPNPMGLAAGFDKDGLAAGMWSYLGFGLAELGATTLHAQTGNPLPRMFRLPDDRAALNRMGANNLGATAMADTLKSTWQHQPRPIPIGINLCKSKVTPLEEAAADYVGSFKLLQPWADYFVINVSSPNTPGLRSLQALESLTPIIQGLTQVNGANKPLLLKIAPDLTDEDILAIVDLAMKEGLSGVIATNTTIKREGLTTEILPETGNPITEEAGGISGQPVNQRSTEVIRLIYRHTQGQLPIVGVGGIFSVEDAWQKITAGASLLQIYTGWIYQGPWLIREINQGLVNKVSALGFDSITDAIGLEHRA